jgi:hypothetical protein
MIQRRRTDMYDVLSPDGFSITPDKVYPDLESAHAAAVAFAERFQFQGFYSTAQRERIPLTDIAGRCRVVEVPDDYLEEDE